MRQLTPGAMVKLGWRDRLQLQLGVQRADYRREVSSGVSGESSKVEERPWMGAASVSFALGRSLRAYTAYARGFEDSGTAPSFAENAGEVLPASRTEQWDAGLRWPLGRSTELVASVFRLQRPKADNGVEAQEYTTLDFGVRYSFSVRKTPVSVRATVTNLTDESGWEVQDDEGFRWIEQRAFQLVFVTDIR